MRVTKLKDTSVLVGTICAHCSKKTKTGQSVAYRRNGLQDAPAQNHWFALHISCMISLVEKAEPDNDVIEHEKTYEQAHKRILEIGKSWQASN